ncbi:MAG: cytoskeletal protein CcmA (bactofilin family) [Rhodothermales bacterium]|jgi:cytoskeletal protein CcmA (bactofilin family)
MTIGLIILSAVTLIVLVLPALPAFAEWRTGNDKHPLTIAETYADDHHVVAKAFGTEVASQLESLVASFLASGGQPTSGHADLKKHYDVIGPHASSTPDFQNGVLPLVLVRNTLTQWPAGTALTRQTYISGAFECGSDALIERLFVDGDAYLGEETVIDSWMHARRDLRAMAGCELNGSVAAGRMLQVWPACQFERLQGGEIRFGDEWHWPEGPVPSRHVPLDLPPLFRLNGRALRQGAAHQVEGNLTIPPAHVWTGDLIVLGNLRLARNARIEGSIKAEGTITLEPGASVVGHVFSDEGIEVRTGACITGTAATEGTLRVRWGAEIGSHKIPSTATGAEILMEQGSRVFGVVMAVEAGRVALRTVARIAA